MPDDHRYPLAGEHQAPPSPDTPPPPEPLRATPLTWWLTIGAMAVVLALAAALVLSPREGGGDADAVAELAEAALAAREELAPVVEEMEDWLPADGSHPPLEVVGADTVHGWRTAAHGVVASLSGEGGSGDPVRTALVSSASLLVVASDTYSKAALVEDEDLRMDLLHVAMDVRNEAVVGWSAAAAHLDEAAVAAGLGHVHAHLPADPGTGALEPDGAAGDRADHEDH